MNPVAVREHFKVAVRAHVRKAAAPSPCLLLVLASGVLSGLAVNASRRHRTSPDSLSLFSLRFSFKSSLISF